MLVTANNTRQTNVGKGNLCRVLFFEHTAKSLPSAKKHTANNFSENLFLKIWNKKDLIRRGPHRPATRPLHQTHKSRHFLCTMRPAGFKPATSLSRVTSSTTAPHYHLCLYYIFFPHILYWTECNLLIWGPKQIQIKNLSTTKFYNFLRSTTFMLVEI